MRFSEWFKSNANLFLDIFILGNINESLLDFPKQSKAMLSAQINPDIEHIIKQFAEELSNNPNHYTKPLSSEVLLISIAKKTNPEYDSINDMDKKKILIDEIQKQARKYLTPYKRIINGDNYYIDYLELIFEMFIKNHKEYSSDTFMDYMAPNETTKNIIKTYEPFTKSYGTGVGPSDYKKSRLFIDFNKGHYDFVMLRTILERNEGNELSAKLENLWKSSFTFMGQNIISKYKSKENDFKSLHSKKTGKDFDMQDFKATDLNALDVNTIEDEAKKKEFNDLTVKLIKITEKAKELFDQEQFLGGKMENIPGQKFPINKDTGNSTSTKLKNYFDEWKKSPDLQLDYIRSVFKDATEKVFELKGSIGEKLTDFFRDRFENLVNKFNMTQNINDKKLGISDSMFSKMVTVTKIQIKKAGKLLDEEENNKDDEFQNAAEKLIGITKVKLAKIK